ncbi:molybdopterin molybdotransferase MoeA [Crocinitomicaceae bacterium]|nr:molybdopterin molybdotransferase MoeA [Crocinitomicaceae bacterium]
MITVEEAIEYVENNSQPAKKTVKISLKNALGFVLAEDVMSPIDMPPFRQSAMDGYAVRIHDSEYYHVKGELQAGDGKDIALHKGEAVRIFTGAPVPNDANSVVIQEKTTIKEKRLQVHEEVLIQSNIRPKGEQIQKGEKALGKGVSLTPAAIGFLTTLGITDASVYQTPSIGIIATGNELAEAGSQLEYGQIYESNSLMLRTALVSLGYTDNEIFKVPDDFNSTQILLDEVLKSKDVVIITGGISVGDYDFVGKALQELKVSQLFYKVKQKPGKPLFFGKKNDTFVFALPGNPAAALSCFYIYVQRCLRRIEGCLNFEPFTVDATSLSEYSSKGDRAQFLKADYQNGKVKILEGQSSSMLHSFAVSNALVYLSADKNKVEKGDILQLILTT